MSKQFYVYIMTNKKQGTIYIGVTSDLVKRAWQHKMSVVDGFTKKYNLKYLVYYEEYSDPENAIRREKRLKEWKRQWKIDLIQNQNPNWHDLYPSIVG
jgi:putative endonuclease